MSSCSQKKCFIRKYKKQQMSLLFHFLLLHQLTQRSLHIPLLFPFQSSKLILGIAEESKFIFIHGNRGFKQKKPSTRDLHQEYLRVKKKRWNLQITRTNVQWRIIINWHSDDEPSNNDWFIRYHQNLIFFVYLGGIINNYQNAWRREISNHLWTKILMKKKRRNLLAIKNIRWRRNAQEWKDLEPSQIAKQRVVFPKFEDFQPWKGGEYRNDIGRESERYMPGPDIPIKR